MRLLRRSVLLLIAVVAVAMGFAARSMATCGPFTDVALDAFCPFVLEVFYVGITTGTTATTYDPTSNVSRLQMAAFLARSVDGVLKRGSRRAALNQYWTPQNELALSATTLPNCPQFVASDGLDLWVSTGCGGPTTHRVRGSDGRLLETCGNGGSVLVAIGKVFVTQTGNPGSLVRINPSLTAGVVTTVASNLGNNPSGITFDGSRIWTANAPGASVSIVTPALSIPWPVTNVTTGFAAPLGALFDGANVWVADSSAGTLLKLDAAGAVLQTVTVGQSPAFPVFDGTSIWVPNSSANSISIVRASTGVVLATLTGNGLNQPYTAAFDGQRVLVTNADNGIGNGSVSLWKSADLTPISNLATGSLTAPSGSCSDGVNFWIVVQTSGLGRLVRL